MFQHNIAIDAAAIARAAPNAHHVIPTYDAIWTLRRSRRAVIGRGQSLALIEKMKAPNTPKPILIVRGDRDSGKSFTCELIDDRVEHDGRIVVTLNARELLADARNLAIDILRKAGTPENLRESLPQSTTPGTTDLAYIRDSLLREFRTLVATTLKAGDQTSDRLLWIILEDLDKAVIPHTNTRTFLDALYESIRVSQDIRIVLIGIDALPAGEPNFAEFDRVHNWDEPNQQELRTFLGCVMTECGISAHHSEIDRVSALLLEMADAIKTAEMPRSRLARLAKVCSEIYYPTAQKWKR